MVKLPPGTPGVTSVGVWGSPMPGICHHKQPGTLMYMGHLTHLIQMGHLGHFYQFVRNLSPLYSIYDFAVKILS